MPAFWTQRSYYEARDAARRAWQRTNDQLVLGLDEDAVTGTGGVLVEPASPSPLQPLVGGGLHSNHAKGGGATLADETRAAPQEGA